MSHWNYRVVKHDVEDGYLAIHEVYYDDGKISMTEDPVEVWGESIDELRKCLEYMTLALDKPVLDEDGKELEEK